MRAFGKSIVGVMLLMASMHASAVLIAWTASLDQAQEVPPSLPALGATGSAFGMIDTSTGLLAWQIAWGGLSGPAVAMHFHGPAPAGANAGVQVNIGAISGLTSPSIGAAIINAAQASDLVAGLWYINIHTAANPGGEIRGQVHRVPEPGTLGLLGAGLIGLAWRRRRA